MSWTLVYVLDVGGIGGSCLGFGSKQAVGKGEESDALSDAKMIAAKKSGNGSCHVEA